MSDPTAASGLRQVEIAANAGITEKHLSRVMRGHAVGGWEVIDAILGACGRELVLGTRLLTAPVPTVHEGGTAP